MSFWLVTQKKRHCVTHTQKKQGDTKPKKKMAGVVTYNKNWLMTKNEFLAGDDGGCAAVK
jgi:hypothetical protein